MRRPANVHEHQRFPRLGDHRPHPQFRPVQRGYRIGNGEFVCQRLRIQIADMYQPGRPGQSSSDKQDRGGQRGRDDHTHHGKPR